jgi:hypothetical protein
MVNTVVASHCYHCGKDFLTGCVVKTICYDCESKGHNPRYPFEDCQVCKDEWEKRTSAVRGQPSSIGV